LDASPNSSSGSPPFPTSSFALVIYLNIRLLVHALIRCWRTLSLPLHAHQGPIQVLQHSQHRDCTWIYRDRYIQSDGDVNSEQAFRVGLMDRQRGGRWRGRATLSSMPVLALILRARSAQLPHRSFHLIRTTPNSSIPNDSHLHIHSTFLDSARSPYPLPNASGSLLRSPGRQGGRHRISSVSSVETVENITTVE
jgi:hypothetical protein